MLALERTCRLLQLISPFAPLVFLAVALAHLTIFWRMPDNAEISANAIALSSPTNRALNSGPLTLLSRIDDLEVANNHWRTDALYNHINSVSDALIRTSRW